MTVPLAAISAPVHRSTLRRREFVTLVLAAGNQSGVEAALEALRQANRQMVDEIHLMLPSSVANRLRPDLTSASSSTLLRQPEFDDRGVVFGRSTIHGFGGETSDGVSVSYLVDQAATLLERLCDQRHDVVVCAADDAGIIGLVAHIALQLVGRANDRFLVLHGHTESETILSNTSIRWNVLELPVLLGERPHDSRQHYRNLVAERGRVRRRQTEPGVMTFDATRHVVTIDGTEIRIPRLRFYWAFVVATFAPEPLPVRLLQHSVTVHNHRDITVHATLAERVQIEHVIRHLRRVFVTLFSDEDDEFPQRLGQVCGQFMGLAVYIAKFNADVKNALGPSAAPYLIRGARGRDGYRFHLPRTQMVLSPSLAYGPRSRADEGASAGNISCKVS